MIYLSVETPGGIGTNTSTIGNTSTSPTRGAGSSFTAISSEGAREVGGISRLGWSSPQDIVDVPIALLAAPYVSMLPRILLGERLSL